MDSVACSITMEGGDEHKARTFLQSISTAPAFTAAFVPVSFQTLEGGETLCLRIAPKNPAAFFKHEAEEHNAESIFALEPPYSADPSKLSQAEAATLMVTGVKSALRALKADVTLPKKPSGSHIEILPLHEPSAVAKCWAGAKRVLSLKVAVDPIQKYFGDEPALYFTWMNTYATWLVIPSIFGAVCFGTRVMFDTTVLYPLYSAVMMIWAVLFVKFWEREMHHYASQNKLLSEAPQGGGIPFDAEVRRGFHGTQRVSPITGERELHYPGWKRNLQQPISWAISATFLIFCIVVQICSLNMQGYMSNNQHSELEVEFFDQFAQPGRIFDPNQDSMIWPNVPVVLHVCVILLLNIIYSKIAESLTTWENYKTEVEHERALIVKRVVFEFIDCYIVLFYVAFYRLDMQQLRQELISLYSVDQFRRLTLECIIPYVWGHRRQLASKVKDKAAAARAKASAKLAKKSDDKSADKASADPSSPTKEDSTALRSAQSSSVFDTPAEAGHAAGPSEEELPEYETFDDYLEMVMQFGYVTMFAAAFPLAAPLSLLSNWVEVRSDAFKLCWALKRPIPKRVRDIGPWTGVLRIFAIASVATNTLLFGFTSRRQMGYYFPQYFDQTTGETLSGDGRFVVASVFCIEHFFLLFVLFLDWYVPSIPKVVEDKVQRLRFLKMTGGSAKAKSE